MYTYDLTFPGNLNVRVEVSLPVFESTAAKLLASAYLPGLSFFRLPGPEARTDLTVQFVVASTATAAERPDFASGLVVSKDKVTLTDFYVGEGSLLDLLHLVYSAVRPLWIKRGFYPVHSVCVGDNEKDGGYTLVVGHSGSGKTAIALKVAEGSGKKILSGNKTLVSFGKNGQMYAVAGTRTMTRAKSDGTPSTATGVVSYQERVAFELGDTSVLSHNGSDGSEFKIAMPIKLIALARLNDGASQCEKLSALSALHKLYPFFIDAVNADTVLCGGEAIYSGALPAATMKKAAAALALGTKSVPVIVVSGSMAHVTKALEGNYGGAKA